MSRDSQHAHAHGYRDAKLLACFHLESEDNSPGKEGEDEIHTAGVCCQDHEFVSLDWGIGEESSTHHLQ